MASLPPTRRRKPSLPSSSSGNFRALFAASGTLVASFPAAAARADDRPLEGASLEWAKAAAEAFFRTATETVPVIGVLDAAESRQALAEFLVRLASETSRKVSGRWIRFSGKSGLFNLI